MQELEQIPLERVITGLQFADGLAWSHTAGLLVADVRASRIFRITGPTKASMFKDNTGAATGIACDVQGRIYMCESATRRVSRMDRQGGGVEPLAETFQGKKFNSPNDIVVRRDYHAFFTDPAFGSANDRRELDYYGIFHITPKGETEVAAQWKTRPNGLALTADGRILYVADSDRHAIVAFDVDKNGSITNQHDFIKNVSGVPGGIRTDVEGHIYVCARGVSIYSAAGKLQRTLLEGDNVSNCAFGEEDLESLYMTSRGSVYKADMGVKGALQY